MTGVTIKLLNDAARDQKLLPDDSQLVKDRAVLTTDHFIGPFLALSIGLVMGTGVFFYEKMFVLRT